MQGRHLRQRDGVHVLLVFLERALVAQVTARIRVAVAGQPIADQRVGLLLLPFDRGQPLDPNFLERRCSEIRLAKQLADELDHRRQPLAAGRDVDAHRLAARSEADVGLQAVELVGDLLARQAGAALVEQGADEAGDGVLPVQRSDVAEAQAQPRLHRLAARALRQQCHLEAAVEHEALGPRIEVGRRRVERLGLHRTWSPL